MQYTLRQKLVSFGNNFTIEGEDDSLFIVKGEPLTLFDKISLQDREGNELAYISLEIEKWRGVYEIHRQNHPLTEVRRVWMTFPQHRFTIDTGGVDDLTAVGDFFDFEYFIKRQDRDIARFTRQWFHFSETWAIEIDNEEDKVFMLALAIIIVRSRQRRRSRG